LVSLRLAVAKHQELQARAHSDTKWGVTADVSLALTLNTAGTISVYSEISRRKSNSRPTTTAPDTAAVIKKLLRKVA
jgi:hypothetical protein